MNSKLSFGIIATLIAVIALGVAIFKGGTETIVREVSNLGGGTRFINGLSTDSTSPSAGQVRTTTFLSTGTSTPTELLFPIGGTITTSATGTALTLDANTTGPKLCFMGTSALSLRNRGTFSPSQVFSIGTSTSGIPTSNIIASTTVATSTPGTSTFNTVSAIADTEFIYSDGDELMAIVGDITNNNASSTHMGNTTADFRILCSELEI